MNLLNGCPIFLCIFCYREIALICVINELKSGFLQSEESGDGRHIAYFIVWQLYFLLIVGEGLAYTFRPVLSTLAVFVLRPTFHRSLASV
jgi:hypothetical protein